MQSQTRTSEAIPGRNLPKIIIIDDDPFQVQLLVNLLKQKNYEIIESNDSVKALEDAVRIKPDLVLLDLFMPQMDGFEICRRLKADSRTRDIPVIFVTASKDQNTESEGFRLGAVDYITKPFNPVVIEARIRTHLELKRHRDSLELLVRQRTTERDKSRQQFQDLVENSLVGIAIVQNERMAYQNPELTRIVSGLEQKIDQKDFDFIHPEHLSPLKIAYRSIMDGKTNMVETDIRLRAPGSVNGEKRYKWFNCRASTFNYQGSDAILINLVDITHTKRLEKLLLNRNKMALLGRIASGMAHEIRNPLTGITSYLYSLEQLCESQTLLPRDIGLMREIVGQLKLASHKVEAVIKRVLDFSKPTVPRMVLMDINAPLSAVLNLTAATMRKAGVEVTAALAGHLPPCYGDAGMMEQVFFNLIQNARRAVRDTQGHKKIEVTSYATDNQICIAVSDSGPGVPKALMDRIFDPFFTTHPNGSGIGLSIAQRIVTDHNGTLHVGSGDLGGACFTVMLPVDKRKFPR